MRCKAISVLHGLWLVARDANPPGAGLAERCLGFWRQAVHKGDEAARVKAQEAYEARTTEEERADAFGPLPRREKPCPDVIPLIVPIAAAAILLWVEGRANHVSGHDLFAQIAKTTDLLAVEPLINFAAAIALIGLSFVACLHIQNAISRPPPGWWNLNHNSNTLSWDAVRNMTVNDPEYDPVVFGSPVKPFVRLATGIAGEVIVVSLLVDALRLLADGPLLPKLLTEVTTSDQKALDPHHYFHKIDLALNANLTALLALIAAAISIYFTHRQLQAKVKAGSRQAWLDKLRGEIAHFIALADAIHVKPRAKEVLILKQKMTASRLEMELMLNPSEKDHRLLMFLSIKLAFFQWEDSEFRKVHDVQLLVDAIRSDPAGYDKDKWIDLLGPIPDREQEPQKHEEAYGDLIGYLMRLSHVVLKREWERVKQTR